VEQNIKLICLVNYLNKKQVIKRIYLQKANVYHYNLWLK